jgi:predicted ABC-type ATPase
LLTERDLVWYDPDAQAREARLKAGMTLEDANAYAWALGVEKLREAIATDTSFAFETTLGANTIPTLLMEASKTHDVMIWFCGLASPEMHIERVALRVSQGGHPIPEEKIRARWTSSIANLIGLLPHLAVLHVYDNSATTKLGRDIPDPQLVLEMRRGKVVVPDHDDRVTLATVPAWAKAIVEAAFDLQNS